MKKCCISKILIAYITLIIIIPLNAQSYEKRGFNIGGNVIMNFIDNKRYDEMYTDITTDFDLGYFITNTSSIGFRLSLLLNNEKGEEYSTHKNDWMSNCYYRIYFIDALYIELFSGYGKHHFKHESKSGFSGLSNIHKAQFGIGVGYYKFLSSNIVIIPSISYDHEILFVKYLDEYSSNQPFNNISLKIGFHYYLILTNK